MNTCFPNAKRTEKSLPGKDFLGWQEKVSWAEKSLAGKGFMGREISGMEEYLGKVLFLRKVSWAEISLPGKGFLEEFCKRLFRTGYWERLLRQNAQTAKLGTLP